MEIWVACLPFPAGVTAHGRNLSASDDLKCKVELNPQELDKKLWGSAEITHQMKKKPNKKHVIFSAGYELMVKVPELANDKKIVSFRVKPHAGTSCTEQVVTNTHKHIFKPDVFQITPQSSGTC